MYVRYRLWKHFLVWRSHIYSVDVYFTETNQLRAAVKGCACLFAPTIPLNNPPDCLLDVWNSYIVTLSPIYQIEKTNIPLKVYTSEGVLSDNLKVRLEFYSMQKI